jgi:hypothetical protein
MVDMSASITISCETCVMRESDACGDCVVSFLLDHDPNEAVVFSMEEARAVKLLASAGLVPTLRHRAAG